MTNASVPNAADNAGAKTPVGNPAPIAGGTPKTAPSPKPLDAAAMARMDESMAASLDDALEGNFETIDAVLDGVFEEQAVLVQNADGSPAAPHPKSKTTFAKPAEQVAPPPSNAVASKDAEAPKDETPNAPPVDEPAAAAKAVEEPEVVELPKAAEPEPVAAVKTVEAPSALQETPAVHAEVAPAAPEKVRAKRSLLEFGAIRKWLPIVVRALEVMSFPLRFVPSKFRPMVDWAALSLLAWVPIVWVMALLSGGGPGEKAHAGAHEPLHETSAPAEAHAPTHTENPAKSGH